MMRARVCPLVVAVLATAFASRASAQPASAQAEVLFDQGRDLMQRGQLADACAAFDSSEKLAPAATTLLNLGLCREKTNQLASAWGAFVEAERLVRGLTDEASEQLAQIASEKAGKLAPRLSTLTVAVPETHKVVGLEVLRDRDVIDSGAWNRALPTDGATYKIVARAPGYETWSTSITVKVESDAVAVQVPKLAVAKVAVAGSAARAKQPLRLAPIVLGASSIVLLGSALGFELAGQISYSDAKAEVSNNAVRQDALNSANDKRYVAEGLAVAGVGCAAAGLWLYFHPPRARGISVEPRVSADRAALFILGRW
jgi:hypothetical protein